MATTCRDRVWNAIRAIATVAFAGVIAACGGGDAPTANTIAAVAEATTLTPPALQTAPQGAAQALQRERAMSVGQRRAAALPAVAGGISHSLALESDGTVWAWGSNDAGQLGNNSTANSLVLMQVLGPGGTGTRTGVTSITGVAHHWLALQGDGMVWA